MQIMILMVILDGWFMRLSTGPSTELHSDHLLSASKVKELGIHTYHHHWLTGLVTDPALNCN